MNVQHIIDNIDNKFKSNNSTPVTRASLSIEEWEELRTVMQSLMRVATGQCEEAKL